MKILLIAPSIFKIPLTGYGGTEAVIDLLARGLAKAGHAVTVVAPAGSSFPEELKIEIIPTQQGEPEEQSWYRYKTRLESGEWDVIHDHTFEAWAYVSSSTLDPELPIVHTQHTVPEIYATPPPVRWPCFVGISEQHCQDIKRRLKIDARRCYNGIDLDFYQPAMVSGSGPEPGAVRRSKRWLFLGRYTPEKNPLGAIHIAQRLRLPLDVVGDTGIVSDQSYVERCRQACDGVRVRFFSGVSREETRRLYQTNKALIYPLGWPEPFGLVPVEASACGMPVFSLRRGALPETITQGKNGLLFDCEEELEAFIGKMPDGEIADPGPEEIRSAVLRFSPQAMVDSYIKLYQDRVNGLGW